MKKTSSIFKLVAVAAVAIIATTNPEIRAMMWFIGYD